MAIITTIWSITVGDLTEKANPKLVAAIEKKLIAAKYDKGVITDKSEIVLEVLQKEGVDIAGGKFDEKQVSLAVAAVKIKDFRKDNPKIGEQEKENIEGTKEQRQRKEVFSEENLIKAFSALGEGRHKDNQTGEKINTYAKNLGHKSLGNALSDTRGSAQKFCELMTKLTSEANKDKSTVDGLEEKNALNKVLSLVNEQLPDSYKIQISGINSGRNPANS